MRLAFFNAGYAAPGTSLPALDEQRNLRIAEVEHRRVAHRVQERLAERGNVNLLEAGCTEHSRELRRIEPIHVVMGLRVVIADLRAIMLDSPLSAEGVHRAAYLVVRVRVRPRTELRREDVEKQPGDRV